MRVRSPRGNGVIWSLSLIPPLWTWHADTVPCVVQSRMRRHEHLGPGEHPPGLPTPGGLCLRPSVRAARTAGRWRGVLAGERTGADAHWGPSDNLACSSGVRVIWKRVREGRGRGQGGGEGGRNYFSTPPPTPASPELLLRIQAERKKTKQNKIWHLPRKNQYQVPS